MIDWSAIGTAAGAIVIGLGSFIMGRGKRQVGQAEDTANVELLQGLVARVQSLETSLANMGQKLDAEVAMRMQAQEDAHRLRLRVMTLESAMRGMGVAVPPEAS